ncbi:hypothetical protein [Burkholderia sp. Ac-20349]|uniref:hypothetical protein n=1 Tax=Burkholderia sp. Ac-20349 TaxID=2703893 RepID=UPI00197C9936|nr:hypothetical protein [Burkholderia sp. Ac-20349]MBN3839192.1 hypothetical protein [Burkholderia sp. Ac-20349]
MATITLRATKWPVKIGRKGQPSLSATFTSEEAAMRWAEDHERGHSVKAIDTGPIVGDLFRKYIEHPMPGKRSSEWDCRTLQRLLKKEKKLCSIPAAQLNKAHLAEWRDRRITEVLGSSIGTGMEARRLEVEKSLRGIRRTPKDRCAHACANAGVSAYA